MTTYITATLSTATTPEGHLGRVAQARAELDAADLRFRCAVDEAVYAASQPTAGDADRPSLRRIAAAAQLSHPGVRVIVANLLRQGRSLGVVRIEGRWVTDVPGGRCAQNLPPYE